MSLPCIAVADNARPPGRKIGRSPGCILSRKQAHRLEQAEDAGAGSNEKLTLSARTTVPGSAVGAAAGMVRVARRAAEASARR